MITTQPTIVEQRTVTRDYDMRGNEVVIDHPKHGRLLIVDGFGGIDQIRGGAVRWEHGNVYQLCGDDTLESLDDDNTRNEYGVSDLDRVLEGYDKSRPILLWDGFVIDKLAQSLGL